MSDQAGEKKFDLSARRREELRQEGNIPRSHDISTTTTLIVGLGLMLIGGGFLIQYLRELMTNSFLQIGDSGRAITPEKVGSVFSNGLWLWMGIFAGSIALAVFVSQVAQVGLKFCRRNVDPEAREAESADRAARHFLAQSPDADGPEPDQAAWWSRRSPTWR